jgi:hypothetical protein
LYQRRVPLSSQAFIQQRIRHIYRRQRPTALPSRTAKSRHQAQLGVDGLDIAHARSVGPRADGGPVESGVQDEIGGLAAEAHPGLAQVALCMARLLDNPKATNQQPAVAKVLAALMDKLRSASAQDRRRFPGRHTLIVGDSRETVPKFTASNPETRFDLVFIDGGHASEIARADLLNMRELSSESTVVIMDDLVPQFSFGVGPTRAWNDAIIEGFVRQDERVRDGKMRGWALGQYVF